ncbi:uncharacterized protein Z519_07252 [Cladophialophora bantiana CBS 173.52]|uniref:Uncharacterized protein n=1 Tax=Cladophialophora bantiana (strain ATCC 10958 / CBS 173.52 / CDC B-1940 / NIH 8579) TaxID=1442370 RepID=A0A0D2HG63_CLAB1|nr:uncharacterized protein Z519_07252 [Cladophialophora bantiana CBS 173.52]KIW92268.1 hypothetical protein Z519_07252 [Cladophialophora bantiana CBS 173.52]
MSDLADEPDHAGNGMNTSFDSRTALPNSSLNEATSPTAPRKSSQTSPSTDQPKKKRKVNHGLYTFQGFLVMVGTDTFLQHVYIVDVR